MENRLGLGIDISSWQKEYEPPNTINWTFVHSPQFVAWVAPRPIKAYFNGKHTIVEWSDGRKTKSGLHDEEWDDEKGIAMAIARRFLGRGEFERLIENANDQR